MELNSSTKPERSVANVAQSGNGFRRAKKKNVGLDALNEYLHNKWLGIASGRNPCNDGVL